MSKPMKSIVINNFAVEYLVTTLEDTPFIHPEHMDAAMHLITPLKEIYIQFKNDLQDNFDRLSENLPKPNAGVGGGKLKASDYAMQIPQEKSSDYEKSVQEIGHKQFEIAMFTVHLEFLSDFITHPDMRQEVLGNWKIPSMFEVGNFSDDGGMKGSMYLALYLQVKQAIDKAEDFKEKIEEENDDAPERPVENEAEE